MISRYILHHFLIICLLGGLAQCNCGPRNSGFPDPEEETAGGNKDGNSAATLTPITEAMIQKVKNHGNQLLEEVLVALQNDTPIDINKQDSYKATALHEAAFLGDPDIVKVLLERNANPDLVNNDNETPLHVAITYGNFSIILMLLESKKVSKANLEEPVLDDGLGNYVTALTYTQQQATKGGLDKADWEVIIAALQTAGATQ
jgi:ankyrin repeat protein